MIAIAWVYDLGGYDEKNRFVFGSPIFFHVSCYC